jgi:hypothetical protein
MEKVFQCGSLGLIEALCQNFLCSTDGKKLENIRCNGRYLLNTNL